LGYRCVAFLLRGMWQDSIKNPGGFNMVTRMLSP